MLSIVIVGTARNRMSIVPRLPAKIGLRKVSAGRGKKCTEERE